MSDAAACEICHLLKFYQCNVCKNVYACDWDERIVERTRTVLGDRLTLELPSNALTGFLSTREDYFLLGT